MAEHPLPERLPDEPVPVFLHRWHRLLYSGGWVGLDVPVQYGGQGLSALHQVAVSDELGACHAPGVPRIGYLAHALLEFGSEEQRLSAGCRACSPVTTCGVRASASREPDRTSRG
ncbi:acyl-CoA dehydrogenase family protein [Streptomyces sp. S1D4-11]